MAHACNPSTWETEAGGWLRVQDQHELHSKTLQTTYTKGARKNAAVALPPPPILFTAFCLSLVQSGQVKHSTTVVSSLDLHH